MLKTMRKNVQSLKSILWIVVATFIVSIFVVWGGAGRLGDKSASDTIATIGGRPIRTDAYFNALRNRIESLKSQMNEISRPFIEHQPKGRGPRVPGENGDQLLVHRVRFQ